MFVSATQIQEVCQRHLSKTNSHLHQMQATKTISPRTRRQKSRNSAAPNERQQDIQQPKTLVFGDEPASSWPRKQDLKKLVEIWRPVFVSATQIQEVCQRHLSKTNSHLHQMQATKTISPRTRRQKSRNSAAPNERQQDIQQPKTLVFGDEPASSWPRKQDLKKLVEIWRLERGAGSEPPPSKVPFKGGLKGPSPGGHEGEKGLKPP